jgi:hypothetical protein
MNTQRKYQFSWDLLGDIQLGRPNLGANVRLEVYRLMQFPDYKAASANPTDRGPGRDCRDPEARDGADSSHPCVLDDGNLCRHDALAETSF